MANQISVLVNDVGVEKVDTGVADLNVFGKMKATE